MGSPTKYREAFRSITSRKIIFTVIDYSRFIIFLSSIETISGVRFCRQFKCPRGQVLLKQGLQDRLRERMWALSLRGGVNLGVEEP
jgi:hypothetical protein